MDNKYELDWLETMEIANEYLDVLEDNMNLIKNRFNDDQVHLNKVIEAMKNDHETTLELEDKLYMFLEKNDYQSVCNQLIITAMFNIFINDTLPDLDFEYLEDYVDSIGEEELIEDVTRIIDKYNN